MFAADQPAAEDPSVPGSDAQAHEIRAHVEAAQNGDAAAFDALVKATYAATYSLAYHLTGNADDAKDVAQDTYLRAFRGLRRFRGESAFSTWLHRITLNSASTLRTKRRHSWREVSIDDVRTPTLYLVETDPETDPAARALAADLKDRVWHAVAALPTLARQIVVLREVEGLTHGAIAERLGITETAAKVRLHRARQRLRDTLGSEQLDGDVAESDEPQGRSVAS